MVQASGDKGGTPTGNDAHRGTERSSLEVFDLCQIDRSWHIVSAVFPTCYRLIRLDDYRLCIANRGFEHEYETRDRPPETYDMHLCRKRGKGEAVFGDRFFYMCRRGHPVCIHAAVFIEYCGSHALVLNEMKQITLLDNRYVFNYELPSMPADNDNKELYGASFMEDLSKMRKERAMLFKNRNAHTPKGA